MAELEGSVCCPCTAGPRGKPKLEGGPIPAPSAPARPGTEEPPIYSISVWVLLSPTLQLFLAWTQTSGFPSLLFAGTLLEFVRFDASPWGWASPPLASQSLVPCLLPSFYIFSYFLSLKSKMTGMKRDRMRSFPRFTSQMTITDEPGPE